MKKVLSISLLMILVLTAFVSCNGAVDERLWGSKEHIHYYEVQNDGSWKCVNKNCPETLLKGTDKPYITVVVDKQPTEIIDLTKDVSADVGAGKIVVSGTDISYTNSSGTAQEVVIRTNGANLTIKADNDTVNHYGKADLLIIEKVGTASYHEFGLVPYAQIQKGRVINEVYAKDEAGVQYLFLVAKDATSFEEIIVASAPNAELPTLDRTDVNIGEGVKVCEVQTGVTKTSKTTDEYVWLFGDGTVEAKKVVLTSSATKPSNEFELDTTTASGKAGEQIANIAGQRKASTADIEIGKNEFAGGAGVEANPYFIEEIDQLKKVESYVGKSFLLTNDIVIDVKDFNNYSYIVNFNGNLDGGKHSITITNTTNKEGMNTTTKGNVYRIFQSVSGKLSNLIIINKTGYVCSIIGAGDETKEKANKLTFEKVDYGYSGVNSIITMTAEDCGLFTQSSVGYLTFVDCNNYYDITSEAKKVGIFVGGRAFDSSYSSGNKDKAANILLSFTKCNNYGDINGINFGILLGNANSNRNINNTTIIDCQNYGELYASSRIGFINDNNAQKLQDELWKNELVNHKSVHIVNDGTKLLKNDGYLVIQKGTAEVSKYVLRYAENLQYRKEGETNYNKDVPMSFKLQLEIDVSTLQFDQGKANTHIKSLELIEKKKFENTATGIEYKTKWFIDEATKLKYAYAEHQYFGTQGKIVIDVTDAYLTKFLSDRGLSGKYNYVGTGHAWATLYGYDEQGKLVSFATEPKE